jgi:hypothetical protein
MLECCSNIIISSFLFFGLRLSGFACGSFGWFFAVSFWLLFSLFRWYGILAAAWLWSLEVLVVVSFLGHF